jgi:hypothetical protein
VHGRRRRNRCPICGGKAWSIVSSMKHVWYHLVNPRVQVQVSKTQVGGTIRGNVITGGSGVNARMVLPVNRPVIEYMLLVIGRSAWSKRIIWGNMQVKSWFIHSNLVYSSFTCCRSTVESLNSPEDPLPRLRPLRGGCEEKIWGKYASGRFGSSRG